MPKGTCEGCKRAVNGHPGPVCQIGIMIGEVASSIFSTGCDAMEKEEARQAAIPDVPMYDKKEPQAEKELQRQAENWLMLRGYKRLAACEAQQENLPLGWFGHMARPLGNPFLPDLMIFSSEMQSCLMIELKTRPNYQPGQKEMIARDIWRECWALADVIREVETWERVGW